MPDSLPDLVLDAFGAAAGEAMTVLMAYRDGATDEGADRVRRAVLNISNGDLGLVRHFTDVAGEDFRDALYWAEYPADADQPKTYGELRARLGRPPDPDHE